MDPVAEIIKYLLGSGIAGLIAAYFAQKYEKSQVDMQALRDRHAVELEKKQGQIDQLHALRLQDYKDFVRNGVMLLGNPEAEPAAYQQQRLTFPRSGELKTPGVGD